MVHTRKYWIPNAKAQATFGRGEPNPVFPATLLVDLKERRLEASNSSSNSESGGQDV
jgi:hypothetical protein